MVERRDVGKRQSCHSALGTLTMFHFLFAHRGNDFAVIRLMANHSQATLLQFISLRIEKGPLTARNGRATVIPGCLLLGGGGLSLKRSSDGERRNAFFADDAFCRVARSEHFNTNLQRKSLMRRMLTKNESAKKFRSGPTRTISAAKLWAVEL